MYLQGRLSLEQKYTYSNMQSLETAMQNYSTTTTLIARELTPPQG